MDSCVHVQADDICVGDSHFAMEFVKIERNSSNLNEISIVLSGKFGDLRYEHTLEYAAVASSQGSPRKLATLWIIFCAS